MPRPSAAPPNEQQDLRRVLGPDGALRVIEAYRAAGKIRFVGLTGHTAPAQFQRMVGEYDFDTILNPAGPVNVVWNDFVSTSIAAARQRSMGVIGMKVMAVGEVPATDRALKKGPAQRLALTAMAQDK